MMCNLSVIFRDDVPLCYGNSLIHKQSTQTQLLLLQKIVLNKNLLHISASMAIIREALTKIYKGWQKKAYSSSNGVLSIKSKINSLVA